VISKHNKKVDLFLSYYFLSVTLSKQAILLQL
jgi:hypothetical protein